MDVFFTLALTAYMMSVGMGLITAGKKGYQNGWFFSQIGDFLKFIGKKISS